MYCHYYGLKERPFNVTSDPLFFYLSDSHKETVSHLLYGVTQRKGILAVTGEIGTGKTTLCRFFLSQLGENVKTALILNPAPSETHLLETIVRDFGIRTLVKNRLYLLWELNRFLLRESQNGSNVVLIIDEAQNLKPPILEQVRLLSNLETEKHKLIQIILVGQPELNRKLELYNLRQLQQRIIVRCHIKPLSKDEIGKYINHRLNLSGSQDKIKFTQDAVEAINVFSGGIPRLINILCDRALLAGFTKETFNIDANIIDLCTQELGTYFKGD